MRIIKSTLKTGMELLSSFTDVLYLTNQRHILPEVRRLFRHKKLSYLVLPIDNFFSIQDKLNVVGTVIIDTMGLTPSQQQRLAHIIESLEMNNIGAILLNGRVELPVKSFSLAPTKISFSMAGKVDSISIDELWVRISVNLAYRKRSSSIIVKPGVPPKQIRSFHNNKLAEQLNTIGELVENLSEQLRMAGLVQRDFMPNQLPNTDRVQWATTFMPATWVSGDIYDVARIDEQHIGFYVVDVVGHSMPAAILTIFLKQALAMRETLENNYRIFPPVEVMNNLNVRMASQKLSGYQFATCCYCLLNINTLQLTYARAGHPYPILIRPGQQPQQLEARGSLLGVFEQSEYVQEQVLLQSGDKVLIYSDGVEPFIGNVDEQGGIGFTEEFYEIKNLPIADMFKELNNLIQSRKKELSEVDDITALGLEIL